MASLQLSLPKRSMMRLFATLLVMLFLSACSQDDLLQKYSSPTDQAEAQAYINQLRSHDYASIERVMDETIKGPDIRNTLVTMASLIPAGNPTSVKLVGSQTQISPGSTFVNTTFEYQYGAKWFLINVAMREQENSRKMVGLNVVPLASSLESQHRFSLAGKTFVHYIVLGAALLSVVITLVALVACVRTRFPRRKWLWVLFILFGFGRFALDWNSGEWRFSPVWFQLFSAGVTSPPYGHWIVSVSIPVGAIYFLYWRKHAPVSVGRATGTDPAGL